MIVIFLGQRGLKLSEEKTVITHIDDGFDFWGWNFRKFKGKLIIKPSHKSMSKITKKLSEIVKENHASKQETRIRKLNEVTVCWVNYHHSACANKCFNTIDHRVWEMLWKWAKRRHPNKCKSWIVNKYWKK